MLKLRKIYLVSVIFALIYLSRAYYKNFSAKTFVSVVLPENNIRSPSTSSVLPEQISPELKHGDFCVIGYFYNPVVREHDYEDYRIFEKHIKSFGIRLITVELAFRNQTFQLTSTGDPNHIQLRTNDPLWYNENLINIGTRRSPNECVYIAWIETEIELLNQNWVQDAKDALERFKTIQLYEIAKMFGSNSEILEGIPSHGYCYEQNQTDLKSFTKLKQKYSDVPKIINWCSPSYGWASKKSTLLKIGGLFDLSILAENDKIIASGFQGDTSFTIKEFRTHLQKEAHNWQVKVDKYLDKKIGYINGAVMHKWHRPTLLNPHAPRREILKSSIKPFHPREHVYYDTNDLLRFTDEGKALFSEKIMNYFIKLDEHDHKYDN